MNNITNEKITQILNAIDREIEKRGPNIETAYYFKLLNTKKQFQKLIKESK
jgi:hypothetical protein